VTSALHEARSYGKKSPASRCPLRGINIVFYITINTLAEGLGVALTGDQIGLRPNLSNRLVVCQGFEHQGKPMLSA